MKRSGDTDRELVSEHITSGLSLWVFTASTFKKMDSTLQPEEERRERESLHQQMTYDQ